MDQSFEAGSHSPVLMDDVSGSGKKRHKYHEGVGKVGYLSSRWGQ